MNSDKYPAHENILKRGGCGGMGYNLTIAEFQALKGEFNALLAAINTPTVQGIMGELDKRAYDEAAKALGFQRKLDAVDHHLAYVAITAYLKAINTPVTQGEPNE